MDKEQLFDEIQNLLELIAESNAAIHRHEQPVLPDSVALEGFRKRKRKLTQQLIDRLRLLELDITLADAA